MQDCFKDYEIMLVAVVVGGIGYALFGNLEAIWGLWAGYSVGVFFDWGFKSEEQELVTSEDFLPEHAEPQKIAA